MIESPQADGMAFRLQANPGWTRYVEFLPMTRLPISAGSSLLSPTLTVFPLLPLSLFSLQFRVHLLTFVRVILFPPAFLHEPVDALITIGCGANPEIPATALRTLLNLCHSTIIREHFLPRQRRLPALARHFQTRQTQTCQLEAGPKSHSTVDLLKPSNLNSVWLQSAKR